MLMLYIYYINIKTEEIYSDILFWVSQSKHLLISLSVTVRFKISWKMVNN